MPRWLLAISIALMLIPAMALVWLGWRLVEQDRLLESEQRRERSRLAAETLAASLRKAIAGDHTLAAAAWLDHPPTLPTGAVLVTLRRSGAIRTQPPTLLLYRPIPADLVQPPDEPFREAETLEYTHKDPARALQLYSNLANDPNPAISAGARLRLARTLRTLGRTDEALTHYTALSKADRIAFAGVPVSLLALRSRCLIHEQKGEKTKLQQESRQLLEGLQQGRWAIEKSAYQHYSQLAQNWVAQTIPQSSKGPIVSAAVEYLWHWWKNQHGAGATTVNLPEGEVAILWSVSPDGLAALIADKDYQQRHWFHSPATEKAWIVNGSRRQAAVTLSPEESGLPWAIAALDEPNGGFASRRRLLFAGLTAMVLLIAAGVWLASRSISKELAVARLQSEFVAAVSHEFRTPLTSLQQFNEMLADDTTLTPEDRTLFHEAQDRATQRLRRLVESLLDFGRMESGRKAFRLEPLDAGDLLSAVVASFRTEPAARGFTLECHVEPVPVQADREALALALWNLLDNAVKYSGSSRSVEVAARRNGTHGILQVTDNGPGIAPHEQRRIFQKFVRGEDALRDSIPGTGIGLAMVEHIVRMHHGRVTVESAPGTGSTFQIKLPLEIRAGD